MIAAPVGTITTQPVVPARDAELLHAWVTHPRSVFWGMQDSSVEQVREEYERMGNDPHHHAYLGVVDRVPQFLTERYDPMQRELVGVPEIQPGDVGMHVLVGPTDRPVPGFTAAVMRAVLQMCFRPEEVRRVVVEPDVRNTKIAALNAAAGFRVLREVNLGHKTAALSAVTREQFATSTIGGAR
ncbi:GNAT family N-acetyltransferase [Luteipulveratus halotolerans]|uniref:Lysine N-acyltransferase MbtK n=1 Tax=Luteipulveratus halotolerans TaxID=1631356 RepID=A0A0L6CHW4_9MICO|nr:GNAT family N-acetyltransferase [Luteipulveratus halotolerans]KNX37190.1 acetyltransferase [Luteipulveratus halotolerans]